MGATSAGLGILGVIGLANSWGSLYLGALSGLGTSSILPTITFGDSSFSTAAASVPLAVDLAIAIATSRYVVAVRRGRRAGGWRLFAHMAVAFTVLLNAAAAPSVGAIGWHVVSPILFSTLVELTAREALGELREIKGHDADRIPLRLWLTTPAESVRVAWRMARTGEASAAVARVDTERCAAARDRLRAALPGPRLWRVRRQILRRLWSGALDPADLVRLLASAGDAQGVHRAVIDAVVLPHARGIALALGNAPEALMPHAPVMPRGHALAPCPDAPALALYASGIAPAAPEGMPPTYAQGIALDALAPEARGIPLAPVAAAEARPARVRASVPSPSAPTPAHARRGTTLADLRAALADGSLDRVTRSGVKDRFHVGTGTADELIRQYREQENTRGEGQNNT